jgi:choline dehydrogenase-like flavoprotein
VVGGLRWKSPFSYLLESGRVITDLQTQVDEHRAVETDVLIVGAGIAGIVLGARLRRNKMRVVILESGGLAQDSDTHPLNRVVQLGDGYRGATQGRYRCLGGTSTRWGGALIPFLANDLSDRAYLGLPKFPVGMDAVLPYLSALERDFGLDDGPYEEDFVERIGAGKYIPTGDCDFCARFAKWPTFKNRNVASLFSELIKSDRDLEVSLNSTVTSFRMNVDNGRIVSATGRNLSGRSISISAKHFVICAGAIETTRLLLLLDRQYDGRVFRGCDAIGRCFYDHISAAVASIDARDVDRLNRLAGFRFVGSTMRSVRFELSPDAQKREKVGSAFGHISFKNERDSGFEVLRQLLRSRQRGAPFHPSLLFGALRDLPYLARLGLWRAVHHQLLWPAPASYELHVVAEQLPRIDNYITLASELDFFGLPLAAINWRITDQDCQTFGAFRRLFDKFWDRRGLHAIGKLIWADELKSDLMDRKSHVDVYHPGGSARMGTDRRSAVVDLDLRVFGVPNLWTASTAAFPSGGGANPTMTLMLFTMRLADHLAQIAQCLGAAPERIS